MPLLQSGCHRSRREHTVHLCVPHFTCRSGTFDDTLCCWNLTFCCCNLMNYATATSYMAAAAAATSCNFGNL
ncbi:hypothetical protein BDA96_05G123800 [Sorghum bicolor]|uniref:Uncharacterized protein n=3 Tax=Sorghum bicolor TaxID=4558 RepID=A0A921QZP1_SORBI|nr:hypothetical protein BDA96_08G103800 [Sorghum bicolor]KAG0520782.1 hypothetical protein BDA96_08G103900 [Sorghum bicolor]KAG0529740.1 hypothetical protein BDA96_05G123800 [Sorghum bicolor]OQU79079.1 hypothetical protein SORBI_3008G092466 [Sorghum bicolor]